MGGGNYFTILEKGEEQLYQETNDWDVTLRSTAAVDPELHRQRGQGGLQVGLPVGNV